MCVLVYVYAWVCGYASVWAGVAGVCVCLLACVVGDWCVCVCAAVGVYVLMCVCAGVSVHGPVHVCVLMPSHRSSREGHSCLKREESLQFEVESDTQH